MSQSATLFSAGSAIKIFKVKNLSQLR